MIALVLDTSTPAITAGLVEVSPDGVHVLAEQVVVDAKRHGELLAVGLREVLRAGRPELVVAGVGPGPFTGLRVGIVTAATFADALAIPVLGVCSLDGLSAPSTAVVTDARRREVYWATYDESGARTAGPAVDVPVVAAERCSGLRVVGDGALRWPEAFPDALELPRYPSVARLAEVAVRAHEQGLPPLPLTPLYLRRPDAEEAHAPKRVTA